MIDWFLPYFAAQLYTCLMMDFFPARLVDRKRGEGLPGKGVLGF
jgi:hypothetical protein